MKIPRDCKYQRVMITNQWLLLLLEMETSSVILLKSSTEIQNIFSN